MDELAKRFRVPAPEADVSGPLGQNAGYLIEFLLALASSPTVSVEEIPIKMYGRYLPDAIATLKCALHGNVIDGGLLNTFCLQLESIWPFCYPEPFGADRRKSFLEEET